MAKESCQVNEHFQREILSCSQEYSALYQEETSFGLEWTQFNQSIVPNANLANIYTSFQYSSGYAMNSFPYTGKVNTYSGGGYILKMQGNSQHIRNNVQILKNMTWIDKQTAAIFVEFSLYNPNLSLFMYGSILFEITSTGNFVSSTQFKSIDLNEITNSGILSYKILVGVVYLGFVVILAVKELKHVFKKGFVYFKSLYNYIDLLLISFSWTAFAMFLYRLYASYGINDTLRSNSLQNAYINLQYISYCDCLFDYFLGMCVALGTIRFIKLFRFNRRIIVFFHAFKLSLSKLATFGVIFMIIWMSFVQVIYLLLHYESIGFASLHKSMTTCFQIILGKFDATVFFDEKTHSSAIVPFIFVLYNVFIVFVMVNVFVTILIDGFELARKDKELERQDPDLFIYIKSILREFIELFKRDASNSSVKIASGILSEKVDSLLERFEKV